jgi:hypothetical protein
VRSSDQHGCWPCLRLNVSRELSSTTSFNQSRCKEGQSQSDLCLQGRPGVSVLRGTLIDPDTLKQEKPDERVPTFHLSIEEEIFLLSFRAENPTRPNLHCAQDPRDCCGTTVTPQFVGRWFQNQFDHSGRFCQPNLVPNDKFHLKNILQHMGFCLILEKPPDHTRLHWLDEKHAVNKDVKARKVRADPLTGCVPCICVNRDFRHAFDL